MVVAIVAAALTAALVAGSVRPPARPGAQGRALVIDGMVDDHRRVASGRLPLGVESQRLDEVGTWLADRLDFTPVLGFAGDAEVPLRGAAIGEVLGRKAAIVVYGRSRPVVSLLVFRAAGLPWPVEGQHRVGRVGAHVQATRGFTIVLWQIGDLAYALVSDVGAGELTALAARIAGPS